MDPRIADYIRANRRRYTREAIRQQLVDAGHDPAEIDATWAVLDTPDADDVAGEGFWGRFWLYLIGANLAVFAVVAVASGMAGAIGRGTEVMLVVFGIALALGALIAWAVVSATQPTRLGRGTALAIGAIIPALLALLIGGSCYALASAFRPLPPAFTGTAEIRVTEPTASDGSGPITCQPYEPLDSGAFSIFGQSVGALDGQPIQFSVDVYSSRDPQLPAPAGPEDLEVSLTINLEPGAGTEAHVGYSSQHPGSTVEIEPGSDVRSGTARFENLLAEVFDAEGNPGPEREPISGSIRWSCQEGS